MGSRSQRMKLLLDEGLPKRQSFSQLNARADLVHIKHDLKLPGATDRTLYTIATNDERVVVTLNLRDFKRLVQVNGASAIGIGAAMLPFEVDVKVLALIRRLKPHHHRGHYFRLDRDTKVVDLVR